MLQILSKIKNHASGFFAKFLAPKTPRNLLILYSIIAIPFFIYHESHLPWHYIFALCIVSLVVGLFITYVSLYIIQRYWVETFHPFIELGVVLVFIFALWLAEVLVFEAGTVFLFLLVAIAFLIRVLHLAEYARLLLAACLIASNALIAFKALQGAEVLSAYLLFKNKYQIEEKDLNHWEITDNNQYWNEELQFGFTLPEGFYFFKPEDLTMENKTGAGQIAGLLAFSDHDAERYPFVRIFYFPDYLGFQENQAVAEFSEFLKIQVSKGDIEDIQEIQQKELEPFILTSKFWTFYDLLRPRYAKTGFILVDTPNHDKLLLHITENLEKGEIHEQGIREFLSSIRFGNRLQSN
ncbi:hypothetical protein ND861_02405 [Leptospira sp. 2 VSF19]|uniref:YIP1 family protein n=1 Tax=Leptospira soteropolitanensis TaxID=2950025 RepID=A0AAW5VKE0_9LEPT|nr:hypothetical protein [Leptospira soteropolitanensis]MCW7491499.1 hypothetical protein [Leptospira soteropolitanensis]MCW7499083.1 hypothetical protein [Leptospira soteropolitanensis]MCW7521325.1 hypothetical protein [Leptospira soteropolitanensis]MCW7525187.1 hypothetical protein [Leptospira soteropolitanensis]MCW7529054.1 hypothetical protein [Leptospira soteropolitanensis]